MTESLLHSLGWLLQLEANHPQAHLLVRGVASDSRQVQSGDVFFARAGATQGADAFIRDAISRGAVAIVTSAAEDFGNLPVPTIHVSNFAQALGSAAARSFADPSSKLTAIGVTGTNGKTTVTHLIAGAMDQRAACGLIGTLGVGRLGALTDSAHTTPDVVELQRAFAGFVDAGLSHAVMEVSSHGIAQGRIEGIHFDTAVFTNLSRDHLDYHGSMEAYGASKARLFAVAELRAAAINADDHFASRIPLAPSIKALRFGLDCSIDDQTIGAELVGSDSAGLHLRIDGPFGPAELRSELLGRFNASNLMAALAALLLNDFSLNDAVAALSRVPPVVGRMQWIGGGAVPMAVVDYAHTPDALSKALQALRFNLAGQLICVFGCGGDRDQGKRAQMARVAERWSDQVIVTDDNPRKEASEVIVNDIMQGFSTPQKVTVEADRARAITTALHGAQPDDVVLIAGKGHEQYQERNGVRMPFNDFGIARLALREYERSHD